MVLCLRFPLDLSYMSANSKGSGEDARMRRLTRIFTVGLRINYYFHMALLIFMQQMIPELQDIITNNFEGIF